MKLALRGLVFFLLTAVLTLSFSSCVQNSDVSGDVTEQMAPDTFLLEDTSSAENTTPSENETEEVAQDKSEIKFLVFSDLHYKKLMYIATTRDVDALTARANESDVDFMIQLGDFCNDFYRSPELFEAYLNNQYGIPSYGVCGNHDMEGEGNTIEFISNKLCNRDVEFGYSSAGRQTAYWYTDIKNFRIIGLDTNYSYSPQYKSWVRNKENSSHAPSSNQYANSLGPEQLAWLDYVIANARKQGKKALVFSHVSFSDAWSKSPDAVAVREIFAKYEGTVILASNGHSHTDHFKTIDKIAYFDVNSVRNGYWYSKKEQHYNSSHTYEYLPYTDGKFSGSVKVFPIISLSQAKNTWFVKDPLSAVVTVKDDGSINIEGKTTEWLYGIAPDSNKDGTKPMIGNYILE